MQHKIKRHKDVLIKRKRQKVMALYSYIVNMYKYMTVPPKTFL